MGVGVWGRGLGWMLGGIRNDFKNFVLQVKNNVMLPLACGMARHTDEWTANLL